MRTPKVYFAGGEMLPDAVLMNAVGVNYTLYTSAHWLCGMLGISRRKVEKFGIKETYRYLKGSFKNTILDSGIFSIHYNKTLQSEKLIYRWYDAYVKFISDNNIYSTLVELDAQRIIGPQKTWELRKDFCNIFKDREIINVFHIEDGIKGLDELIEFSPYIGISAGDRRKFKDGNYETLFRIVEYIRSKKPCIKIHLLGCTTKDMLRRRITDTCDSSSWNTTVRFRSLFGKKISMPKEELNRTKEKYEAALKQFIPMVTKKCSNGMFLNALYRVKGIECALRYYQHYAGDQS